MALALFGGVAHAADSVSAEYARQVDTVQARLAAIEGLHADLDGTVRRLEDAQQALAAGGSGGGADETLVRELRGQIESMQYEVRTAREALDTLATDLDTRVLWSEQRLTQIEAALGLQPPPLPGADATSNVNDIPPLVEIGRPEQAPTQVVIGGGEPAQDAEEQPTDAAGLIELAEGHMEADRQRAARAVLDRVLTEFAGSSEISVALYRRAETYFNEGDWGTAANEFQKVVDRYPRSDLAAWSMFYQGECFVRRGQGDTAALFWENLVAEHPGTDAAAEARSRLGR